MPRRTVAHAAHAAAHTEALAALPAWEDRQASDRARRASKARAGSTRRRRVDPTTCDLDYTQAQLEFMRAIQDYKQASGRMYPTWSEVLEVLVGLGYVKAGPAPAPGLDPRRSPHPPRRGGS